MVTTLPAPARPARAHSVLGRLPHRMRSRTKLLAILLGAVLPACEATPPSGEQSSAASEHPSIETAALGDVEPLDANDLGAFASWMAERKHDTWFLVMPYWKPAYAIVIGQTEPKSAMEPPPWSIDYYLAKRSAHQAGGTPPIEEWDRTQLALDPLTARSIVAASQETVRRARYPKPDINLDERGNRVETVTGNADGTAYYFGTWRFRGSANMPRAGFAHDLAMLADRLRKVVEAKPEERKVLVAECVEFANNLRARAEAAPW